MTNATKIDLRGSGWQERILLDLIAAAPLVGQS